MKRPFILIDPGHGGSDPGAVSYNAREAAINLAVAQSLGPMLSTEGFDVAFTRYFDQTLSLSDRVALAGVFKPDLFLSLHCNAAANDRACGIEVFSSHGVTRSDQVATFIYQGLAARFPATNFRSDFSDGDPDKEAGFYVLTKTTCPAVLLEMGFVTSQYDRKNLLSDQHRILMVLAIAAALVAWRAEQ